MTDEQVKAAAVRAVACKGWHFGATQSMKLTPVRTTSGVLWMRERAWRRSRWLPDLRDPATLGCLVAQVREAYSDEAAWVCPEDTDRWVVFARLDREIDDAYDGVAIGTTEAEAWVAALEAAP